MSDKIKNQEILFSPGSTYWGDVWLQFKKHKGAWFVDLNKPSNFKDLTDSQQKIIDEQINEIDANENLNENVSQKLNLLTDDKDYRVEDIEVRI